MGPMKVLNIRLNARGSVRSLEPQAGHLAPSGSFGFLFSFCQHSDAHNPLQNLTGSQVRNVFTGTNQAWSDFSKGNANSIVVWSYPQGNEIRQFFEDALSPVDLLPSAHLAPDPHALRQSVAADPSAIGYLPGRWVDTSVRRLTLTNISENSLRRPILAATQATPQGAQKEWLLCLQRSIAQK